ncbi:hypothetical protein [Rhizobium sp. LCM 4573]|uniref:hypothetical protein n=1 Tax=Rhizobium sp. LCM 4573 TaxID=1848291 RepID=UPI0008D8E972|nr:hypothetical protein [Rhizobium sp. LCM 4573]OHV84152.1 hypothetical protein LCM4573_00100 [Rhizobium sp. LCM 4573]
MFIAQKSPNVSVGVFKNHLGEPLFVASGMVIGTVEEVSTILDTYKEGVIKLESVPVENAYYGPLQAADLSGIDFAGLASGLRSLADWLQDASEPKSAQGAKPESIDEVFGRENPTLDKTSQAFSVSRSGELTFPVVKCGEKLV